jgi:ATP-binding protein involved in chromosome partitioning
VSFRTYFDVPGADGSRLLDQVLAQRARVAARLALVERVVVVLSGKGGVGKSYVTAAMALALARRALAVGVVDADLHGPTVPRLLDVDVRAPLAVLDDGVVPPTGRAGIRVMSTDLLLDEGRPLRWATEVGETHTWRGPAEASVLREFLADVRWGALAALLVDMPPDAGRLADLAALVPNAAAVAVTIPTLESERAVARALDAARAAGLALAGIVENMSGYACARCDHVGPLFPGDAGVRLAESHGLPLLARLPFSVAPLDEVATRLDPVVDHLLRGAP